LNADGPNSTIAINVTSGAPATIVSKSITYTAKDQVIFRIWGAILNDSGSSRTYSIVFNLGSLTATLTYIGTIGSSATNRSPLYIEGTFTVASTSSAWLLGRNNQMNPSGLGTFHILDTSNNESGAVDQHSSSNLTGAQTTSIQMYSSSATATQSFELHAWNISQIATNP